MSLLVVTFILAETPICRSFTALGPSLEIIAPCPSAKRPSTVACNNRATVCTRWGSAFLSSQDSLAEHTTHGFTQVKHDQIAYTYGTPPKLNRSHGQHTNVDATYWRKTTNIEVRSAWRNIIRYSISWTLSSRIKITWYSFQPTLENYYCNMQKLKLILISKFLRWSITLWGMRKESNGTWIIRANI